MVQSSVPLCNTCGEQVGLNANGEVFVACHECNFPICKDGFEHEINEDHRVCMRCGTPYEERTKEEEEDFHEIKVQENEDDDFHEIKVHENQFTTPSEISNSLDVGLHARHVSTVSTVDSEVNEESGKSIWKNRVESWKGKDKKDKKKKAASKEEKEASIPPEQQMEEIQPAEASAAAPLSVVIPMSKSKIAPYRTVIIMRLIILGLFFHYRVTNPVESAFPLWLTSIICEIWFAFSWVLDQFPKWSPINRQTFIDNLSARL